MCNSTSFKKKSGMTLIEVLVASALMLLIFGALFSAFESILSVIGSSKSQAGAVSLANERMEYIRSLPYSSIGTKYGIPAGILPEVSTTTLNGVTYTQRILVEYIDNPKDGLGASDTNTITTDYKLVKVQYSWTVNGALKTISLISNIVPRGIETNIGGGTLLVNVFDANVQPVSGAAVHIYNNTGTSTIDTTRYTNTSGVALFGGAPARANYQITVTGTDYSTDQTYSASSTNPLPVTSHVAVVLNQVSTMNFQIDRLSDFTIVTNDIPTTGSFEDLFDDVSKIASSTGVTVSGGSVILSSVSGNFVSSGSFFSSVLAPTPLSSWDTFSISSTVPAQTTLKVHVYDATNGTLVLIPDSALAGNSTGFSVGTLVLSTLSTTTYQTIAFGAVLTSANPAVTPSITQLRATYTQTQLKLPIIAFTLTGAKKIGTLLDLSPVYKYKKLHTTNGNGILVVPDLEWDVYDIAVTNASYDIREACTDEPYTLAPNGNYTLKLTLAPATAQNIRVKVLTSAGVGIPDSQVELRRGGFSQVKQTSVCGQTYFDSGVTSASDYELEVQALGYATQIVTAVNISGDSVATVTLVP